MTPLALFLMLASAAGPSAPPTTPVAVGDVLFAQSFTLREPYRTEWRKERPEVERGMIVVLEAPPELLHPRQSLQPVLYVGDAVAERMNVGYRSRHVVAIVPGEFDLHDVEIWFGAPDLPERVAAETVARERARARTAGVEPFSHDVVETALRLGGIPRPFADRDALHRHVAALIQRFAPDENDLAEGMLAPRVVETPF